MISALFLKTCIYSTLKNHKKADLIKVGMFFNQVDQIMPKMFIPH